MLGEGVQEVLSWGTAPRGDVLGGTPVLWTPGQGAFLSWGRQGGLLLLGGPGAGVREQTLVELVQGVPGRSGEGCMCWKLGA